MDIRPILTADQQLSQRIRIPPHRPVLRKAAALFAHSADSWYWVAGLLTAWIAGPRDWRPLLVLLLASVIFTAVLVLALKFLIRRPRPEGPWGEVYRRSDPHSFPSGHAARAALLTVLLGFAGPSWLIIPLLLWALGVNFARIGLGVHYLSDVIGGTAIGVILGCGLGIWWM